MDLTFESIESIKNNYSGLLFNVSDKSKVAKLLKVLKIDSQNNLEELSIQAKRQVPGIKGTIYIGITKEKDHYSFELRYDGKSQITQTRELEAKFEDFFTKNGIPYSHYFEANSFERSLIKEELKSK